MKKVIFLLSALFIVSFVLSAQQTSSEETGRAISFSDLKSLTAQSTDNQLQGQVADVVLSNNGEVRYLAIQANQALGSANQGAAGQNSATQSTMAQGAANQNNANQGAMTQGTANQVYLVPPMAGKVDFEKKTISYDISADQMNNIPSVSMSDLESGKGDWKTTAQNYWQGQSLGAGERIQGESGGTATVLASQLLKYQLTDVNGGNQQPITELYFNAAVDDLIGVSIHQISGENVGSLGSGAYNAMIPLPDPVRINTEQKVIISNYMPEAFGSAGANAPNQSGTGGTTP